MVASQMTSQIVLIEQTNFLFYLIKIRLEMAEIWPKVEKQLATAILGDQLAATQMASQMVQVEWTNFLFYSIKIRLKMAEIWPKVAIQLATAILGDQLGFFSPNFWASQVKLRLHAKFQLPRRSGSTCPGGRPAGRRSAGWPEKPEIRLNSSHLGLALAWLELGNIHW